MSESLQPCFLIALPRTGSTLVQRVLGTYPEVATAPEPWLMMPLLSPLRTGPPRTPSWAATAERAVTDFVESLPDGRSAYHAEVRELALNLYRRASTPEARLFLDKSTAYYAILDHLFAVFPDARFVFLWRNPLSVVASTVETWCRGRWQPERHRGDLFNGVASVTDGFIRHRDRAVAVRYEDLVTGDEATWRVITDHLGLEFDPASLVRFRDVKWAGAMGDPTGVQLYNKLETSTTDKWRATVMNRYRREWCRRYLCWIGQERLSLMGYDLDELLAQLAETPVDGRMLRLDLRDAAYSMTAQAIRYHIRPDDMARSWRLMLAAGRY